LFPSITATQEFVVPKSIPMIDENDLLADSIAEVFYLFKSVLNIERVLPLTNQL
jgi:hypothetical protein